MSEGPKEPAGEDFVVERTSADKLTEAELQRCVALVRSGEAVKKGFGAQSLMRTSMLVVARRGGEIAAVGAIKKPRAYTATTAENAGYDVSVDTPELGYIAVDKVHRGNHLSTRIVDTLLKDRKGSLFATTDEPKVKKVLKDAGFEPKGKEWQGERGQLSLWIKD